LTLIEQWVGITDLSDGRNPYNTSQKFTVTINDNIPPTIAEQSPVDTQGPSFIYSITFDEPVTGLST
jgi:hypothetical protein